MFKLNQSSNTSWYISKGNNWDLWFYSDCVLLYSHLFCSGFMFHYFSVFVYLYCCLSVVNRKCLPFLSTWHPPPPWGMICTSVRFLLAFLLSVILWSVPYDYLFGIFRLFQISTNIDCFQIYHNNKQVLCSFINVLLIVDFKY